MSGDLERRPACALPPGPGAGPGGAGGRGAGLGAGGAAGNRRAGEPEQVLVAAWLTGLRSARTRRAYAGDVAAWLGWLAGRDTGVLAAGRAYVDRGAAIWLDGGAAASSVRRRLSALSSFYRYCAAHDLIGRVPTAGVAWPTVDPDYTGRARRSAARSRQVRGVRVTTIPRQSVPWHSPVTGRLVCPGDTEQTRAN